MNLDDLIKQLQGMPDDEKARVIASAQAVTKDARWIPNPGPQTEAYFSPAKVLLYGGAGGGGKSDLGLGLAFTKHRKSLVLRRQYTNLGALIDRALEINGTRDGYSGATPPKLETPDGRLIRFGANQHPGDEEGWQGQPFDLKVFDEACQFLESQVRFHLGWLRTTDPLAPKERAVLATNPPLTADGDWLIKFFRPWLDITHHNPAKPGELRWFVTAPDGSDLEVPDATPLELAGRVLTPSSRTFIPAKLNDNPFLAKTDYVAQLDGLPEPLRSAVRDGNFMLARQDAEFQVIPMQWVIEAQNRWKKDGYKDFAMTAMGFDPAGGGRDSAELAWRHGGWYAPLVTVTGADTANGSEAAARIIVHRRDAAPVVIDTGGGYGGAVSLRLKDNGIPYIGFNASHKSTGRTQDGQLKFGNKRAEAWWRFREALNPDQEGGSAIALPDDPELRSDLTSPTFRVEARGLLIESKDELRKRLGRSPGKGDAVVMCFAEGNTAQRRFLSSQSPSRTSPISLGYSKIKRILRGS